MAYLMITVKKPLQIWKQGLQLLGKSSASTIERVTQPKKKKKRASKSKQKNAGSKLIVKIA